VPLLEVDDVVVRFGGLRALDHVTFGVEAGAVTGLIGPNGAGKTTCFNVVTGLQPAVSGTVRLDGRDITRSRPYARARLGLGRTFQRLETFRTLTARENVLVAAEMAGARGRAAQETANRLIGQMGIGAVADERVEQLPTGTQRLVELARALASDPRVLLLDEPSSGLNDAETDAMADVLRELAGNGLAILLVEHDMPFVMELCSTIHVLEFGRLITTGTPAEVQRDPAVRSAYLGDERVEDAPAAAAPAARRDTDVVLELEGVRAGYGLIDVVEDVAFDVRRGEVLALLGPNGAGKSTVLKVASGQLRPSSGVVRYLGEDVTGNRPEALAKRGLCCVPEGRSIFPTLTVAENLLMSTHLGTSRREIEEVAYGRFPVLGQRRTQAAGTLSGGEQQMLAMARGLATNPTVLLLDELSMGLAPLIVEELYEAVAAIAAEGSMAIVIVEQFAHDVLRIADHGLVLTHGRVVLRGRPDEVAAGMDAAYLGLQPT
jgi:ABC-type branched-subunit amino acid transport system ATPase component